MLRHVIKACEFCGKEFSGPAKQKFCSAKCRNAAKKEIFNITNATSIQIELIRAGCENAEPLQQNEEVLEDDSCITIRNEGDFPGFTFSVKRGELFRYAQVLLFRELANRNVFKPQGAVKEDRSWLNLLNQEDWQGGQ